MRHNLEDSWAVIVNPTAGRGKAAQAASLLMAALEEREAKAELLLTSGPEHAEQLARRASDSGANIIVACGGDGTIHEVINGIMSSGSESTLGILSGGTCNDLAYALGLPNSPDEAIRRILELNVQRIDLGRVDLGGNDYRYFATIATLGFDSEVSEFVDAGRCPSFLGASASYLYAAVLKLITYRFPRVTLHGDFETFSEPLLLAAIGNTDRYGARIRVTPAAQPDDGLLDVCIVRKVSKLEVLRVMPRTFSGNHVTHPAVRIERTRQLQIDADRPLWIWGDGERLAQTPITVEIAPSSLRVIL
jgi:diacylglycerol kinase (ATP)